MNKLLTTILCAVAVASSAMAATVPVGYALEGELKPWGTGKTEVYNAAIKIDDAALIGQKITAIQFTWQEGTTAAGCEVFLASELKLKSNVAVGDLAAAEFTPEAGICTVPLAEPWTIDRATFYAGYTFKVGSPNGNEALSKPILLGNCAESDACYFSSSRTYRGWQQPASLAGLGFSVRIIVEGDYVADAAGVKAITSPITTAAEAGVCTATVVNHGTNAISSIDYSYTVCGQTVGGSHTFSAPIAADIYGCMGTFTFTAPLVEDFGEHTGTLTITKVNGVDNTDTTASAQNTISVTSQLGKQVIVMEEFTGTWCQWCVRGLVAMHMLNEQLGDNFIALAYHNGDPMTITNDYPVKVDGFPMATVNRVVECDPYYGFSEDGFGILDVIDSQKNPTVPANIAVTAEYNDDESAINIEASAYFFRSYTENPFRLAYVLTADGLVGPETDPDWYQSNAYYRYPATELPGGEDFCKPNGKSMMRVAFDDVVVAYSPYGGEEGSLPEAVMFNNTYSHSYTFDITGIKEHDNPDVDLIQNKDNVYVNVLLIDASGKIVNAGKCHVTGATSGVSDITTARSIESVEYFDLSGRRIDASSATGFVIESVRYTDGSKTTAKRIIR